MPVPPACFQFLTPTSTDVLLPLSAAGTTLVSSATSTPLMEKAKGGAGAASAVRRLA